MATEIKVSCPECGSADIREKNMAYTELRVTEWSEDELGVLTPEGFETDTSPEWASMDGPNQFICGECRWSGDLEDLRVAARASDETPAAPAEGGGE